MSNLILGSSNADYHANKTHLSSSALKQILKDPQVFYEEYILGLKRNVAKDAFTEGSFTHSLILEPEKVQSEYAIYPGLRKHGKAYEDFKEANPGKTILSAAQLLRCERLFKAYNALPAAVNLIKNTLPEHNMMATLSELQVKARADAISIEKGYIVDVKTTSMPAGPDFFKTTLSEYMYDLSAALYCDIAASVYGKPFDFYWLVLSKVDGSCEVYRAKAETLATGRAAYTNAILIYKNCLKTGIWALNQPKELPDLENYEILEL